MSIPTAIAVKRSVVIVSIAVRSHAHASLLESLTMRGISLQWLMLQTLDNRMPEITGSGIEGTKGTVRKKNASRKTAVSTPAIGVWAPPGTFIDV